LEGLISSKVSNLSNELFFLIRRITFPGFITTQSSDSSTGAAASQSLLRWIPGYDPYSDLFADPDADPCEARFECAAVSGRLCTLT
jgi:hypothetical protein